MKMPNVLGGLFKGAKEASGTFVDALFKLVGTTVQWLSDDLESYFKDGYSTNHHIGAVIDLMARRGASLPFVLYRRKGDKKERIDKHEILDLLNTKPNSLVSASQFKYALICYYAVTGNAYIYGPRTESKKFNQLYTLPSPFVRVTPNDRAEMVERMYKNPVGTSVFVKHYTLQNSPGTEIPADDVLHIKHFNPEFGDGYQGANWYGQSPLRKLAKVIVKSNKNIEAAANIFDNIGIFGIISRAHAEGSTFTPEQSEKIEKSLARKARGVRNIGKIIFSGAQLNYTKLGQDFDKLKLSEDDLNTLRAACNVFGVPSVLLNDKDGAKYDNMTAAKVDLWTNAITPILTEICQALQVWVSEWDETLELDFDWSAVPELKANLKETVDALAAAWWMDVYTKQKLTPDCSEDDTFKGVYMMPANLVQYGKSLDPEKMASIISQLQKTGAPIDYLG